MHLHPGRHPVGPIADSHVWLAMTLSIRGVQMMPDLSRQSSRRSDASPGGDLLIRSSRREVSVAE